MTRRKPAHPRTIDWDRVKQRLAAAHEALQHGFTPSDAQRRRILEARARALAAPAAPAAAAAPGVDVLEFVLNEERYALPADAVREVLPLIELTAVPCTPSFVSGIINARGRILAVIDLTKFYELAESGLCDRNKVIIVQHEDMQLGVLADRVVAVNRLALSDVVPAAGAPLARRAVHLRGMTADGLLVLDAAKLVNDPALIVDEEVAA